MAFQLTKARLYGVDSSGASLVRGVQRAELYITALVTDVALDLASITDGSLGTFWTAVVADTTYGVLAENVRQDIKTIVAQATSVILQSEQLEDRLQAAATSGTSYTKAITGKLPTVACAASNGETAWILQLQWTLADGIPTVNRNYN